MFLPEKGKTTTELKRILQGQVQDIQYQVAGLRYLMESFRPDWAEHDRTGTIGIGLLLGLIEGRARRVAILMDETSDFDKDVKIEFNGEDADPLIRVELAVERMRTGPSDQPRRPGGTP